MDTRPHDPQTEFELIDWLRRQSQNFPPSILRHIGDDCAVFDPGFTRKLAVTSDMLLEDVHFRRRWINPFLLGRKSLLVNLSDLSAMGAHPYACLLNLAVPKALAGDYFRSFMEGFLQEGRKQDCPLVGGDLSRYESICVSVTAFGSLKEGDPAWRSAAQPGDLVLLVGDTGFSRLGFLILQDENPADFWELATEQQLGARVRDSFRRRCLEAHLLPRPPLQVGAWLCENSLVHAMIDVSDGLVSDLMHILHQSGSASELELGNLPLPEQGVGDMNPLEAALNGGEDYALLFTASEEQVNRLAKTYPGDFPAYRIIGRIIEGEPAVFLLHDGIRERYEPRGFDHFR